MNISTKSFVDTLLERLATGFAFTEGPVWSDEESALFFTDIPNSQILQWRNDQVSVWRSHSNKANGLAIDPAGRLLCCEHATSRVTALSADGATEVLAATYCGRKLNSPNDIVVHSNGRIYFTDPIYGRNNDFVGMERPQELAFQGVYAITAPGAEPTLLCADFIGPNGLCFSLDESRLYVNDSERRHIRAFDVLPDGTLSNDRVFFTQTGDPSSGVPDGMKVDSAGNVLCSGPRGIWRISPDGELLEVLEVPEVVANFAFGGADRDWLYITAATSLYRVPVAVPGPAQQVRPLAK
jgi:gluconolactonase